MKMFDFVKTPPLAANSFERPDARWKQLVEGRSLDWQPLGYYGDYNSPF